VVALSQKSQQLKEAQAKERQARQTALEAARQKQQAREREFRELLLQAQQDVAASRDITLRAEQEQRAAQDEVFPSSHPPPQQVEPSAVQEGLCTSAYKGTFKGFLCCPMTRMTRMMSTIVQL
jgi:hypothetical protein